MGPVNTSNSDANLSGLNAQNHRWRLGPIETSISDANDVV